MGPRAAGHCGAFVEPRRHVPAGRASSPSRRGPLRARARSSDLAERFDEGDGVTWWRERAPPEGGATLPWRRLGRVASGSVERPWARADATLLAELLTPRAMRCLAERGVEKEAEAAGGAAAALRRPRLCRARADAGGGLGVVVGDGGDTRERGCMRFSLLRAKESSARASARARSRAAARACAAAALAAASSAARRSRATARSPLRRAWSTAARTTSRVLSGAAATTSLAADAVRLASASSAASTRLLVSADCLATASEPELRSRVAPS